MEYARQRYNLGHFISLVIGCLEKCLTRFRIDGRNIKRANLFAYWSSSATRVIKLCIVARIEWRGKLSG